jgi:hypothetical protein
MRQPNHALAHHLKLAGWRSPQLAIAINALLGSGYTSRSTVSEWVHAGRVPRAPLPAVIAMLLSEATGNQVTVDDLWSGTPVAPTWTFSADDGIEQLSQHFDPISAVAQDWIRHYDRHAACDRRRFIPVPRSSLPVTDSGSEHFPAQSDELPLEVITRAVAIQLAHLPESPAALRFAHRQVIALAETLIDASGGKSIAAALAIAVLAAGELAEAVGKTGLSQRYHVSGCIIRSALHRN